MQSGTTVELNDSSQTKVRPQRKPEQLTQENIMLMNKLANMTKAFEEEKERAQKLSEENDTLNDEVLKVNKLLKQEKKKVESNRLLAERKGKEIQSLKRKLVTAEKSLAGAKELAKEKEREIEDIKGQLESAVKTRDLEKRNAASIREVVGNLMKENEELKKNIVNERNIRGQAEIERNIAQEGKKKHKTKKKTGPPTGDVTIKMKLEGELEVDQIRVDTRDMKKTHKDSIKVEADVKMPQTNQKMRDGVSKFSEFTRDVLAGLATPLLELEGLGGMLDTKASVRGRRKLLTIERELRTINREASRLHIVAKTILHNPDSADWSAEI